MSSPPPPPEAHLGWYSTGLRCSAARQNIELSGDDHAPVTRGRMRAQYPLPRGPRHTVHTVSVNYTPKTDPQKKALDSNIGTKKTAGTRISHNSLVV